MNKHTQGPWAADKAGGVIAADGFSVGIAFQKASTRVEYEEGGWLERDAVANARLMAAAPELLEALKAMHEVHGVTQAYAEKHIEIPQSWVDVSDLARAAIAKAEGK